MQKNADLVDLEKSFKKCAYSRYRSCRYRRERAFQSFYEMVGPKEKLHPSYILQQPSRATTPPDFSHEGFTPYCDATWIPLFRAQSEGANLPVSNFEFEYDRCNSGLGPLFHRNFGRLVLGCIDSYDSEIRRIFQRFSRSTRFILPRWGDKKRRVCLPPKKILLQEEVYVIRFTPWSGVSKHSGDWVT